MNRLVSSVTQELSVPAIESSRIMLAPAYEIVQEKRCHPEKPCSETYESARVRAMMGTTPPACLRISQRGQENEADWYAHKAMTMRLRSVTDIRQRRELVAASMGVFCGFSYSRVTSDKDKLKIEKELERLIEAGEIGAGEDNHAPSGHRISAAMTDEIASLLQCTKEKDKANAKPSYQSCRL